MILISSEIGRASENIEKLRTQLSSTKTLMDSLWILKPNSKNYIRKLVFLIIELFIARKMVTQANTMELTKEVFESLIAILIALIAIVFTGYAFFQALLNDTLLKRLSSVKNGNLSDTNKYFAEVMIFQMTCTVVNLLVIIFTIILPNDWCAFNDVFANELVSGILIFLLLYCNIESIWEMKSFIFNVFQLFNLHAYLRLEKSNEEPNKDKQ